MKLTLIIVAAIIIGIPTVAYLIGMLLPVQHVATSERSIAAPAVVVAEWVRDVSGQTKWRDGVRKIEILQQSPTLPYRETSGNGQITFLFREVETARRFESVIDDPTLPFGGMWNIALEPQGNLTRVVIREEGEVRSPIFRFASKYVFGHDETNEE